MKQEILTTGGKASAFQHSPIPATRARASRTKDGSRLDSPNGAWVSPASRGSPRHSPPEANYGSRARRPILPSKPKQCGESIETPKGTEMGEVKTVDQPRTRAAELYATRTRRHVDTNRKGSEYQNDGKGVKDEVQRRLIVSESMVKELQSEVFALKAEVERLQSRNVVLESQNKQLGRDLSSAESKIKALEKQHQQEVKPSEFKDVRELIASKLELFPAKRDSTRGDSKTAKMQSLAQESGTKSVEIQPRVQLKVSPPPLRAAPVAGPPPAPPPPPPPRNVPSRTTPVQQAPALVEFYHSMTKRGGGLKGHLGGENHGGAVTSNAHNSIVDELQNRSAHLLAIKADVEKKGDFIKNLIHKVQSMAFTDIEEVPLFVDWLDEQLSTLADERAVLKHFNWPERKADALREAAFEYRDIRQLLVEVSSFEDDAALTYEAILKKITTLLDKSERSVQRLVKLRNTTMVSYRDCKIPTDWMLDSGMISKLKLSSVKLARVYIKRVSMELEFARHTEREAMQQALLLQGVRFAYRAYQFAGELDSDTMRAFEELRERVQIQRR